MAKLKVRMWPDWPAIQSHGESGIKTVISQYDRLLPELDVEFVREHADLYVIHAGMSAFADDETPRLAMTHGLYWTHDLPAEPWQHKANAAVIRSIVSADAVSVPSHWVAETLQRDLHLDPIILPHGIDLAAWTPPPPRMLSAPSPRFVLWNKNRASDVCDPRYVQALSLRQPDTHFVATVRSNSFPDHSANYHIVGVMEHARMQELVHACTVYASTTKETFGIGILEAMAAGKPVLGFREGNITALVEHGVSGYLAEPGNIEDLEQGLFYCFEHARALGEAGREAAKRWDWKNVVGAVRAAFDTTVAAAQAPHDVTVVIPCYNKGETVLEAVRSAWNQSLKPSQVIVVDNNSDQETQNVYGLIKRDYPDTVVHRCEEQGVAHARNRGIDLAHTRYTCCLDADDLIKPDFLQVCVEALRADRSLGLAYTKLAHFRGSEQPRLSAWPAAYDYDAFLQKRNQVPTCCVFRRDLWARLGGYRQKYAPTGAGAEDAEFWLRMGAIGYKGELVSDRPLFLYRLGGAVSGASDYVEPDWLRYHPWCRDKTLLPLAAPATPTNGTAHLVRQYDQPLVSVVIPLSRRHLRNVQDAIDSLEAQTFLRWEVIVVEDFRLDHLIERDVDERNRRHSEFPFVRWISASQTGPSDFPHGPAWARNTGAAAARSSLLLFLDADDWLEPSCLQELYQTHLNQREAVIYSDYYGHFTTADPTPFVGQNRLVQYNPKTQRAVVHHHAFDYDWQRAQRQPELDHDGQFYVWNLVSSLVPKEIHDAIGGFDEQMPSWEDWDYWLRIARAGVPFVRLAQPLISYRFETGERREIGRQIYESLIEYLTRKYEEIVAMPCRGCGGGGPRPKPPALPLLNPAARMNMNADEMVEVELIDGNRGDHPIAVNGTRYGYRRHGDTFLMRRGDAIAKPHAFLILGTPTTARPAKKAKPAPPPPPMLSALTSRDEEPVMSDSAAVTSDQPSVPPAEPDDEVLERILGKTKAAKVKPAAKKK